jgi:hypothetical protein
MHVAYKVIPPYYLSINYLACAPKMLSTALVNAGSVEIGEGVVALVAVAGVSFPLMAQRVAMAKIIGIK